MYYGWRVVFFTAIIYGVVLGFTYSSFGLFVIPVAADLNLSRAEMNTALILLNVGSALFAPVVGRLLDRMPARRIMFACSLLFGLSLGILSISTSIWLSAAVIVVMLSVALQGSGTLTVTVLLARWFTTHRARAMLLSAMGASLGSIAFAPAIGWLIEQEGWRFALQAMAAAVTIILLAITFSIRDRPDPGEIEGSSPIEPAAPRDLAPAASAPAAPAKVSVILKMPKFWTIGISAATAMAIIQAITISMVPLAVQSGMTAMQAASLISVTGAAAITSKLVLAVVADKFDRVYLLACLFALGILVNVFLLMGTGQIVLFSCAIMLGVASSAIAPTFYALLADTFDLASFGTVRGLMATMIAVIGAVAMRVSGEVYDRFGNYDYLFYAFMVLGLLAVGLILLTRRIKPVHAA